jgi:hypothetical protein
MPVRRTGFFGFGVIRFSVDRCRRFARGLFPPGILRLSARSGEHQGSSKKYLLHSTASPWSLSREKRQPQISWLSKGPYLNNPIRNQTRSAS